MTSQFSQKDKFFLDCALVPLQAEADRSELPVDSSMKVLIGPCFYVSVEKQGFAKGGFSSMYGLNL